MKGIDIVESYDMTKGLPIYKQPPQGVVTFITAMEIICSYTEGFQVWSGGYVSCEDKVALMACVPVGYPEVSVQWFRGDVCLVGEEFPVIYVTKSFQYYCVLSATLKYQFIINLGIAIIIFCCFFIYCLFQISVAQLMPLCFQLLTVLSRGEV